MRPENNPDGQRRSFIEEARRRQIIASTVEVISEVGYGHASLARIAEHAGISKGVISYHFDGKDELMSQVVIELFVAGAEFMVPTIVAAAEQGPRAALHAYLESNLRFIDANKSYVAACADIVVNLRNADGSPTLGTVEGDREAIAPLVELLADGQRAGVFGDFDPTMLARLIRDSIDGVAQRAVRESDFDVRHYISHLTRVYDAATRKNDGR
ncbi:TetR family transcriptional regulator [Nocardia mangyaensis]|uniref:TetR family transcriptional regulator n=1 Tax=Nocardia mangyaensis TaxID=2213200 RepID=A0A1J0VR24_9NOCA|nr:TetR family transcriptional regulator [Nocardia mangyaensis]APE34465.1 TetR family transcriptional regulator [Nocardia mangyaensis]